MSATMPCNLAIGPLPDAGIAADTHGAGVLPRAALATFHYIAKHTSKPADGRTDVSSQDCSGRRSSNTSFSLDVQFLEVYNEEVYDLLAEPVVPQEWSSHPAEGGCALPKPDIIIREGKWGRGEDKAGLCCEA